MQSVKFTEHVKFNETLHELEDRAAVQRDPDGPRSRFMKLSVHMQRPAPGKEQCHAIIQAGLITEENESPKFK